MSLPVSYLIFGSYNYLGLVASRLHFKAMLFFMVFSVLWNISNCAVIKTVELAQLDDGMNWRENPLNGESNYLDRFSSKPLDKDLTLKRSSKFDELTAKLFHQEYFRPKGFDRNRSRGKRYIWDDEETTTDFYDWLGKWTFPKHDRTVKPTTDYGTDYSSSSDGVLITSLVIIVFVAVVIIVFRECAVNDGCCKSTDSSYSSGPDLIRSHDLHLPPSVTAPFPATNRDEISFNPIIAIPSHIIEEAQARIASNNLVDKPPDYSEVIISDFGVGENKFPEVKSSDSYEMPPPRYEAGNIQRY